MLKNVFDPKMYLEATTADHDPLRHDLLIPAIGSALGGVVGRRVIDVGCGPGMLLPTLWSGKPASVVACDMCKGMLELALKAAPQTIPLLLDIRTSALPKMQFDLVICVLTLNLLSELDAAIINMTHGLVTGGKILICVPHPCFHFQQQQIDHRESWSLAGGGKESYHDTSTVRNKIGKPTIEVSMHHRSISRYFRALREANLNVEALIEPGTTGLHPWDLIPAFLIMRAEKR